MSSVGEILRSERERQGLDLARVAAQTRISSRYLQAIENDDPGSLPGGFFYRSFVHQYGEFLGVDQESLESGLDRLTPVASAASDLRSDRFINPPDVPPLPTESRGSSAGRLPLAVVLLVTAVIASSAIYALWQRSQQVEEPRPTPPAAATSGGQKPAPKPVDKPADTPAAPQAAQTTPSTTTPPAVATAPDSNAAAAPPGATAAAPARSGTGLSLEFMATEDAWVSVTADGKPVIQRVLKGGETRTVSGSERLTLLTGNAGGLVVTANGKLLDPIGPRGQVRTVEVTAEGAQVRAPVPKKPAEPKP